MIITRHLLKLYRTIFIKLGFDKYNTTYTRNFYKRAIVNSDGGAKYLTKYLLSKYKINSILDIGCGNGVYLRRFYESGVKKIIGIDISENALKESVISLDHIKLMDLSKYFNLNRKFDIVICIEVAEHIPGESSDLLVENISRHGNLIIFTAATPGQGGTDHINEQPKEYWISKFKKAGLNFDNKETIKLSKYLMDNGSVFWLYKNLMVFNRQND